MANSFGTQREKKSVLSTSTRTASKDLEVMSSTGKSPSSFEGPSSLHHAGGGVQQNIHERSPISHAMQSIGVSVAQLALDQVNAKCVEVRDTLCSACGISDGAYLVRVGFNEDMIRLGTGILQEIYVHINFDITGDTVSLLHSLGKVLCPFPSMLFTPTMTHTIPIFSVKGEIPSEAEVWPILESRKIFVRGLGTVDRTGETEKGRGRGVAQSHSSSASPNSTGGGNMSGGSESNDGNSSRDTGGREEERASVPPGGSEFPGGSGGGGTSDDGGGGNALPDPNGKEIKDDEQNGKLFVPFTSSLEVEWVQCPRICQRFSTTSIINVTVCNLLFIIHRPVQVDNGHSSYTGVRRW